MPGYTDYGVVHVVAEVTPGTYVAPTVGTSLALRLSSKPTIEIGSKNVRRDGPNAIPGGRKSLVGGQVVSVELEFELTSWGDTQSATDHDAAALWASMAVTITAAGSPNGDLTIAPTSTVTTARCSVTYDEPDGNRYKIAGGVAELMEISSQDNPGAPILVKTKVTGLFVDDGSASAITFSSVAYSTQPPIQALGGTLSSGVTGSPPASKFSFVPGSRTIERPATVNAASTGYAIPIPAYQGNPELRLTFDGLNEAETDILADWYASTATSATLTYGADGSQVIIGLPEYSEDRPDLGDRDGLRTYDVALVGYGTSSAPAWRLIFS